MELEELDAQIEVFRPERAGKQYPPEFQLFDSLTETGAEITEVEAVLGTRLPSKYKRSMQAIGAGVYRSSSYCR